jgi:hypothetical protein
MENRFQCRWRSLCSTLLREGEASGTSSFELGPLGLVARQGREDADAKHGLIQLRACSDRDLVGQWKVWKMNSWRNRQTRPTPKQLANACDTASSDFSLSIKREGFSCRFEQMT